MAGLVPAIHVLLCGWVGKKDVDARHKAAGMTEFNLNASHAIAHEPWRLNPHGL
jgi:hypothetical protein